MFTGALFTRTIFKITTTSFKNQKISAQFSAVRLRHNSSEEYHSTTILSVRKGDKLVVIGDGQVSRGAEIVKSNAKKVRRLGNQNIIAGFAGATADALTLIERLESKLEEYPGQLLRAAVELSKLWRTDRYLRRLEAVMIVADENVSLTLTGNGDVLESTDGVVGIGSGGAYAKAAAKALIDTDMDAETVAKKSMQIASDICVYTNSNFIIETLPNKRK